MKVFIFSLLRDNFDYTEWQRDYFSNIPLDDFLHNAQSYGQKIVEKIIADFGYIIMY
jgi:hypothetical protein